MKSYSHLIEINEERRQLVIYRIDDNHKRTLFSTFDFPGKTFSEDEDGFRRFANVLGENLLADSPAARKLLGL